MRQALIFALSGIFLGLVIVSIYNGTAVAKDKKDERAHSIQDKSVAGRKTDVPLVKDMDEALRQKEADLSEKERVLKEKEEALAVEDQRVKQRIDELEALQTEVMKFQKTNSENAETQFKRLVKTIESMNPKKSAQMFMTMKDDLAVELMMAMKEKKVAAVLDLLESERANQLSKQMAQRRPAGRAVGDLGQAPSKGSPLP
jgi:flagellar motility protein MotE (MotC chaperone)